MNYRSIGGLSVSDNDRIGMPDGGIVIVADYGKPPPWYTKGAMHFLNNNIFRLDQDGKVIWQVVRKDEDKVNWSLLDQLARKEGKEGAQHPFMNIWCFNPQSGETSMDANTGIPLVNSQWKPGLKLMARAWDLGNDLYEIDIGSGTAKNVSLPGPKRAW